MYGVPGQDRGAHPQNTGASMMMERPVDWNRRRRPADTILDTAGLTPLVRLRRVVGTIPAAVFAKVEYFGPSGSVKDRILPYIVAEAERRGELRPGMVLVEGTTGNTGIATAMVGAAKGYRVIIVMPEGMSRERQQVIRAYGADLVLTPGGESDVDLVLEKVRELKAELEGRIWEVGQFTNLDNVRAHQQSTGPEIWSRPEAARTRSSRRREPAAPSPASAST
jgi:cysteine synthase A